MKKTLIAIFILFSLTTIAKAKDGMFSRSPDKKWYLIIMSSSSKIKEHITTEILLYNVENQKDVSLSDMKTQVPVFEITFPGTMFEGARQSEVKWNNDGFEVILGKLSNRVFKYKISSETFSLETFERKEKNKTSNKGHGD